MQPVSNTLRSMAAMNRPLQILICSTVLAVFAGCDNKPKTVPEKIEDKVKDGLDTRPNEKLKDTGEDLKDAAKDAKDAVKDAAK
jgi:hypothetical protein